MSESVRKRSGRDKLKSVGDHGPARSSRHYRAAKTELGGLEETPLEVRYAAQLAGEPYLTDEDGLWPDRSIECTGRDGRRDRQISRRLLQPETSDHVDVDVLLRERDPYAAR